MNERYIGRVFCVKRRLFERESFLEKGGSLLWLAVRRGGGGEGGRRLWFIWFICYLFRYLFTEGGG